MMQTDQTKLTAGTREAYEWRLRLGQSSLLCPHAGKVQEALFSFTQIHWYSSEGQ